MTHSQERLYLIRELMRESGEFENKQVPEDDEGQKRLLRALFNVRDPRPISEEFLRIQDSYLTEETKLKGIVDIGCTESFEGGIHLWQGDITRLSCDAIVNASNVNLKMVEGVGRAIFHKAGDKELTNACKQIGHSVVLHL